MPLSRKCVMLRMAWAVALLATAWGCSESGAVPVIDQKAALEKATGGSGNARQSAKAKAAEAEAGVTHPKLK